MTGRATVRPTSACLTLAVMQLAMMLGAVNYGSNAAYVVMSLVSAVGLVSALHGWRNLSVVRVVAGETVPAFAGEPLRATVLITNAGPRDAHFLACDLPGLQVAGGAVRIPHLAAGKTVAVELVLPARARGLHAHSGVRVSTIFPMGLFRWARRLPGDFTWMVYPRPAHGGPPEAAPDEQAEAQAGGRPGGGDFRGHRTYQAGDPQRHIDWKAVARGRTLLVKEYDGGGAARWWIDWQAAGGADAEQRLSLLAGWVVEAERDGVQFGLRLPDRELPPASGPNHYHACLCALALFPGR